MRNKLLSLAFLLTMCLGWLRADEGMWLPMFIERLNYADMKTMGLKLTPEEIYSVNNNSLKDAIIVFGRGCTGEVISAQGLVLTNHHCGYGQIQAHSAVAHDYLTDGFWARTLEEELSNEGLTARFMIRMDDVTARVLEGIDSNTPEAERNRLIRERIGNIEKEAAEGTHYDASVQSFFFGSEFYLFIYETFKDVRLVGAPPSSIGKFGYDTDNWMWPRHTGDFALFRIYTGPDGKPAAYSKENIPLVPRHHLPISLEGIQKDDFAMILGYPGRTSRYMTSYGIDLNLSSTFPSRIAVREKKLEVLKRDMDASPAVRIQYASKYAGISNYWKNFIGMSRGLKRLKVYDKKQALETDFSRWLLADAKRQEVYGEALSLISDGYEVKKPHDKAYYYLIEAILTGAEMLPTTRQFETMVTALEQGEKEKAASEVKRLREVVPKFFKDYNQPTDQRLLAAMLEMYYRDLDPAHQPAYFSQLVTKYKGDFARLSADLFKRSIFDSQTSVNAFLDKPSAKTYRKDPAVKLMAAFMEKFSEVRAAYTKGDVEQQKGYRLFVAGLREMHPDKSFYPDANFTMRLSYGSVQDYYPADAVHYDYRTTLLGVMEKEDPGNYEFLVPEKLKELYKGEHYGPYGENGTMYVCFLTNHDITGGNSGSPVLNGKGELIGLAFDGNWEAMSGDIAFEPDLQRTINVDIRYVLFIMDKFADARNLMKELTLVGEPGRKIQVGAEPPVRHQPTEEKTKVGAPAQPSREQ